MDLSIKELKSELRRRGADISGCVEKRDLIALLESTPDPSGECAAPMEQGDRTEASGAQGVDVEVVDEVVANVMNRTGWVARLGELDVEGLEKRLDALGVNHDDITETDVLITLIQSCVECYGPGEVTVCPEGDPPTWTCNDCQASFPARTLFCESCGTPDPSTVAAPVGMKAFTYLATKGYPFMRAPSELADLPRLLKATKEFSVSWNFHPGFIDEVVRQGHFPMTIDFGVFLLTPKCHTKRCIAVPSKLHFSKTTIKKAGKLEVTTNCNFEDVVKLCVAQHGENWLCRPLSGAFLRIHQDPRGFLSRFHSIEIWKNENGRRILVAGELGYTIGTIYTSLTGAYTEPGTGQVQLAVLNAILMKHGYEVWDLGMSMDYKKEMGATEISREEWLAMQGELRGKPHPGFSCPLSDCRAVIRSTMPKKGLTPGDPNSKKSLKRAQQRAKPQRKKKRTKPKGPNQKAAEMEP